MSIEELLEECKKGLDMSISTPAIDESIAQKIRTVKSFMKRAGVPEENMYDDLAAGIIVMGVSDLWELQSGEVKFSPAFTTMLTQLTY
jgi:hypothetical protein